jgi:hypothetical protein
MMKQLLAIGLLLLFFACNKNTEDDTPPESPGIIQFKGITSTDENGQIIGNPDTTDWRIDDVWSEEEASLFSSSFDTNCTPSYDYQIGVFPNPCNNVFSVFSDQSENTVLEVRLVTDQLQTLLSDNDLQEGVVQLILFDYDIQDTARLYYRFIEDNCEFRGHGDIVFE